MSNNCNKYKKIIEQHYNNYEEDERFNRGRFSQVEYLTTLKYILKFAKKGCKILEIGAGTGRYSIELAKLGYNVTAIELVDKNLTILKDKSKNLKNIKSFQGDVLDLNMLDDNTYDVVLNLGPMYHLYNQKDKNKAIKESLRVCKTGGICMFAYITHSAIVWAYGVRKNKISDLVPNIDKDWRIKDIPQEIFSSFYVEDFQKQFKKMNCEYITTVATDSIFPLMREFLEKLTDDDYTKLLDFHFKTCERFDQLGFSSHLLHICRKK